MFTFLRNCQTIFWVGIQLPPQVYGRPQFLYSWLTFCSVNIFYFICSNRCVVILFLISLIDSDFENLLKCLYTICNSSLVKQIFIHFCCHFLIVFFLFLLLNFQSSSCILYMSPMWDTWFAYIFSFWPIVSHFPYSPDPWQPPFHSMFLWVQWFLIFQILLKKVIPYSIWLSGLFHLP